MRTLPITVAGDDACPNVTLFLAPHAAHMNQSGRLYPPDTEQVSRIILIGSL
jgi:hypothetical protein